MFRIVYGNLSPSIGLVLTLLLGLTLGGNKAARAQESVTYFYRQFTLADGLPTNKVYSFAQDKDGFFWAGTDKGLSWFDGVRFHPLSAADGFNSLSCEDIVLLRDSSLVAVGVSPMRLYWLKENKVVKSIDLGPKWWTSLGMAYNPNLNYLSYSSGRSAHIYDLSEDRAYFFHDLHKELFAHNYALSDTSMLLSYGTKLGLYWYTNSTCEDSLIPGTEGMKIMALNHYKNNELDLFTSRGWYRIDLNDNYRITTIRDNFESFNKLNHTAYYKGSLWYTYFGNGVAQLFPSGRFANVNDYFHFGNIQVNNLHKDNSNNLWISTHGKGLYVVYHSLITNYSIVDGLPSDYITDMDISEEGKICFSTNKGAMWITPDDKLTPINSQLVSSVKRKKPINTTNFDDKFIIEVDYLKGNWHMSVNSADLVSHWVDGNDTLIISSYSSIGLRSDSLHILGHWNFIRSVQIANGKYDVLLPRTHLNGPERLNDILYRDSVSSWVAGKKGLYIYEYGDRNPGLRLVNDEFPGLPKSPASLVIEEMHNGADGSLWLATSLGLYQLKEGQCRRWGGFTDCSTVDQDAEERIWVGTNDGLYRLDSAGFVKFHAASGLISDEINKVMYDSIRNVLWVGTVSGLSKLDLNLLGSELEQRNPVIIHQLEVIGDTSYSSPQFQQLDYTQNGIRISYSLLASSSPKYRQFAYKLIGVHKEWIPTNASSVEFTALAPGEYTFTVRGRVEGGIWSEPANYRFSITPPFWKRNWFILGSLLIAQLLIVSVLFRYYRGRIRKIRHHQLQKDRIRSLEQKARNATLNPHFVFNALNSIQSFTGRSDKKGTIEFIADFARLIRTNMDVSEHSHITIAEEIERLTLFMNIEKRRLGGRFDFNIQVSEQVDSEEILIPNMILQPVVENSIWHGIAHLDRPGKIDLVFDLHSTDFLLIHITDNGVGLQSNHSRPGHSSKGVSLTRQRLGYFSPLNRFYLHRLIHPDGSSAGTRAEFLIQID
ncbi:histidine kinase [bacterium SCSIO 12741]|nr:histidine kinase [bacterium SCSIO 12741]